MASIKFYKGESMSIVFTAYDRSTPAQLVDISAYTKAVTIFTPYTDTVITPTITPIGNSSFSVLVTGSNTMALKEGAFNIMVKLTNGTEVKIGKAVPCMLINPNLTTPNKGLHVDEGQVMVNMLMDDPSISVAMYFGSSINITTT